MDMKIVADNKIKYLSNVFDNLADIVFLKGSEISNLDLKDADALLVRTRTICNKKLLENTNVKFVGTATIGYDHIDIDYLKNNNIEWQSSPGCNSGSVCQYFLAALVCLIENYKLDTKQITIGIIGLGNVGQKIYKACKVLGINVLAYDPFKQNDKNLDINFVSLQEIQKKSDIITFHVPLTKNCEYPTYLMCDNNFIQNLKDNVIIINSSRGDVVDNKALLEAINNKKLLDAVIDVWQNEPDINLELLQKIIISTPHIAGYSMDGKADASRQIVRKLAKKFNLPLLDFEPKTPICNLHKLLYQDLMQNNWMQIVKSSYDIKKESDALKQNPELFESFRENYALRSENL